MTQGAKIGAARKSAPSLEEASAQEDDITEEDKLIKATDSVVAIKTVGEDKDSMGKAKRTSAKHKLASKKKPSTENIPKKSVLVIAVKSEPIAVKSTPVIQKDVNVEMSATSANKSVP